MPQMMEQEIVCRHIMKLSLLRLFKQDTERSSNRSHIFKLVKNFEAHGTCEDCMAISI